MPVAIAAQRLGVSVAVMMKKYVHATGEGEATGVAALHEMLGRQGKAVWR
jgi:hypothetical protein